MKEQEVKGYQKKTQKDYSLAFNRAQILHNLDKMIVGLVE